MIQKRTERPARPGPSSCRSPGPGTRSGTGPEGQEELKSEMSEVQPVTPETTKPTKPPTRRDTRPAIPPSPIRRFIGAAGLLDLFRQAAVNGKATPVKRRGLRLCADCAPARPLLVSTRGPGAAGQFSTGYVMEVRVTRFSSSFARCSWNSLDERESRLGS